MTSGRIILCSFCALSIVGCATSTTAERAEMVFNNPQPFPQNPAFILSVAPSASETVSLSSPDGWGVNLTRIDDGSLYWGPTVELLCVEIYIPVLLRPGDDITAYHNVEISLDSEQITESPSHLADDVLVYGPGDSMGSEVDRVCWPIDVQPGIHIADLTVWTSTREELTYSWAFEVVP